MPQRESRARTWLLHAESLSLVLAAIGIAIAGYLTLIHYRHSLLVCTGVSDCETVQTSRYAELLGIPVALLGLAGMVLLLALAIARLVRPSLHDTTTLVSFLILAGSVMFYIYLTYIELFVIDAICQWCVASFVVAMVYLGNEARMIARMWSEAET